jgi:glycosyltransferase involved in cell wall biosynthesis
MKIFVHSALNDSTIASQLGRADYSYYYVRKMFEPLLATIGEVIAMDEPWVQLEEQAALCKRQGDSCVYLSFTPPHKMWTTKSCACIPVFAWEYGTLPDEAWAGDPRNNWVSVLRECEGAITHSGYARDVTQRSLGKDFNIISIPAPLWNSMQEGSHQTPHSLRPNHILEFTGHAYDSLTMPQLKYGIDYKPLLEGILSADRQHRFELSGVVYTAVFNPNDGRKNWPDLFHAFCWAFREDPTATLVVKLTHHDAAFSLGTLMHEIAKTGPVSARIIGLHGYLDENAYKALIAASHYTINSSFGEGQCLPLMEFMASGKPVIAPRHTAMLDYLDDTNGFPVKCSMEWTHWPHDPRSLKRTYRYRLDWESMVDALLQSHRIALERWQDYVSLSTAARARSQQHCSMESLGGKLRDFLQDTTHLWSVNRQETPCSR